MSQRISQPTILVLCDELGFVLALSQELSKRKIAAFPARSPEEAQSLISRFGLRLDLLVMDCSRPGACAFAEAECKEHAGMRVIGITSPRHQCRSCGHRLTATFRDPEDLEPDQTGHCADVIEMILRERRRAQRAGGNH